MSRLAWQWAIWALCSVLSSLKLVGTVAVSLRLERLHSQRDGELAKPLLSYGARVLGEKISVDLAFINFAGKMVFPGIPYVYFVVRF